MSIVAGRNCLCCHVCFFLALVGFAGCSKPAPPDPQAATKLTASMQVGAPLTDDDCREFSRKFALAIEQHDIAGANAMIDWDALTAIAAVDVGFSAKDLREITTGLKQSTGATNGLTGQIIAEVEKGSSYELLRVHRVDSAPRAMFRLWGESSGINYHDLLLARRPDGQIRIVDIEIAASGELFSQTLRRMMIPLASAHSGIMARLQGKEAEVMKNLQQIQLIAQSVEGGQPQQAINLIKKLPPTVQQDKLIMMFRVRAATSLDDETEYNASIEDFVKLFPNDACLPMILVDYYLKKGDNEKALKQLNLIDKSVGGDPTLNIMRANLQLNAGDLAEARKLAEETRKLLPEKVDAYWVTVNVAMKEMKFDEALATLKEIKSKFNVVFSDFTTLPDYAEFVKSPQYKEWLEFEKGK